MKTIKFTHQGIQGVIEVTDHGAFVRWGDASFPSSFAGGALRVAIALAILEAGEQQ